jgi:protein-S-isoprenylcysteine O-methyltransferase Ste14
MASRTSTARAGVTGGVLKLAGTTIMSGVLLFLIAGTVRWTWGWIYLALISAVLAVYSRTLMTVHPDLVEERQHPPADAKAWDKPFVAIIGVVGPIALFVACGMDHRFGWSPAASTFWHVTGLVMVAGGGALTNWAIRHNRFFSGIVRIQRDRGHVVVDSGPYRLVRHPGYVGSVLHTLGTSLALGSWWSLAVGVPVSAALAVRTALEDRTLRAELEGYDGYAQRVRFRLLPGIW